LTTNQYKLYPAKSIEWEEIEKSLQVVACHCGNICYYDFFPSSTILHRLQ